MTFKVIETQKETCRQWADTIERTATVRRNQNYTELNEDDRWYHGYIGETGFRDALWYYGKRWHYSTRLDGYSDNTDMFVWRRGAKLDLDVKTNAKEYGWHLMLPERQFQRYHHDIYVGAHLIDGGENCRFEGWVTYDELAERSEVVMLKVETRRVLFTDLNPMADLLAQLDDESLPESPAKVAAMVPLPSRLRRAGDDLAKQDRLF